MQTQVPQPAPQPVRMVNSAIVEQPDAAVCRIACSVTPLQRHTYMARNHLLKSSYWPTNENDCQSVLLLVSGPPPPPDTETR